MVTIIFHLKKRLKLDGYLTLETSYRYDFNISIPLIEGVDEYIPF